MHEEYPSRKKGKEKASASGTAGKSADDEIKLVHLEDIRPDEKEKTRMQKMRAHFVRFWLCYGIAVFILLAAGLPILYVLSPFPALHICNKP
jgi:hypothetical protein